MTCRATALGALALGALIAFSTPAGASPPVVLRAAPAVIHLVSPADQAAQRSASSILGPSLGQFPSRAPGPITGDETIRVGLNADGSVASVIVDQTLTVRGTGDFTIEISGPALGVTAPPDARTHPGLRNGSVIWEGFSPGRRVLRSTITLDPNGVRFLPLPLRVTRSSSEIRIQNQTVAIRPADTGVPDAAELARVLDAMRAELAAGRAPIAGTKGIPATISARSPVAITGIDVPVPFNVRASAGSVRRTAVVVTSLVIDASSDSVRIDAQPALPDAIALSPPRGVASWRAALTDASDKELRDALVLAQTTLWEVLRRADYEAYLGNPLGGSSRARYLYAPQAAAPIAAPRAPLRRPRPVAIALALAMFALAATGAVRWWQRS